MLFLTKKYLSKKIPAACLAIIMGMMMPLAGCSGDTGEVTGKTETTTTTATAAETSQTATSPSIEEDKDNPYYPQKRDALDALETRLNENRKYLYVYKDYGSIENAFTQKAKMYGKNPHLVDDLNEHWISDSYDGYCIRCAQKTREGDWNAWMWMTGYLPEGSTEPVLNDGSMDGQGYDLTGAEKLTFYARCDKGRSCTCEFFTAGFGRDASTGEPIVKYPDSCRKIRLGRVHITDEWQQYTIPLEGKDLSYIVAGFGYAVNDEMNGNADVIFYLDEIRFEGDIKCLKDAPVLIKSYNTKNMYLKNAVYSYDNACSAMAFMAAGRQEDAKQIVDAFVYAVRHDRALAEPVEGRIDRPLRARNAYGSGIISPMPGWGFSTRIPGWYNYVDEVWCEDRVMCGINPGNISYMALALLHYYNRYGGGEYLDTAASLMDWVILNCSDGRDGFTGGFDGWEEADPPVVYKNNYRSLEHNIDCYACFKALYDIKGDQRYKDAYESSLRFIKSLYDPTRKLFLTGTTGDGVTPDRSIVVLDAQVWCAMALGDEFEPYKDALTTVEKMKTKEGGYPFYLADEPKPGIWCEGTAFTALLYRELGDEARYKEAMDALTKQQLDSGLFPAASVDGLETGIYLFDGKPWVYNKDPHITPTAWMIMAATEGFNPYVIR